MRQRRLLEDQRGAAPIDALVGMLLLLMLALGAIEVALALYARNVVASASHEAARVAVELDAPPARAAALGRRSMEQAVGGLLSGVAVRIDRPTGDGRVTVLVETIVRVPGPIPLELPMSFVAHAFKEGVPR